MTEQQAQQPELQLPDEQQQLVEGIHIAIVDQKQNQIDTVPGENRYLIPQQNMPITPNYPMQTPTNQNPSFTVQYPQDLTVMAMHKIYINDEVKFEHVFERKTPWFGSIWSEKSIFNIPGLGILSMGDEYKRHMGLFWRLMPNQNRRNRRHHDYRGSFNSHFFKVPDYIIENENIEMDYWNCIGTIIVGGIPLLQFQTTQPNSYDVVYGHCCVGFPKVILYQLLEPAKRPLIIVPDVSKCPESVLGLCGLCSLCGTCTKERFFTVEGLTQGSCI